MKSLSSLGTRFTIAIVATALAAFAALVALTVMRLDRGLNRQALQLEALAETKLSERLDADAKLAAARLHNVFDEVTYRINAIALRADVGRAITSRNVVAMSELLSRAAEVAKIDGILVIDNKMHVMGSHDQWLDILGADDALQKSQLADRIRPLLADNDRRRPRILEVVMPLDEQTATAIGAVAPAPAAAIVVTPIFDDFGDVVAALIAHRALRASEPLLNEFSRLTNTGVAVLSGDRIVSRSGLPPLTGSFSSHTNNNLLETPDGHFFARCIGFPANLRVCALAPRTEAYQLRDETVRIGAAETRALVAWLVGGASLALIAFAAIALATARHVTRPLERITEAVGAVAQGDWRTHVSGANRKDEVGDIARAVVLLQRSLQERDQLRTHVAFAETVKQRREALEQAIHRFDETMRSVLVRVGGGIDTMDAMAHQLADVSAAAEREAVEAVAASESTVSSVTLVKQATEQLSTSIAEIAGKVQETATVVDDGNAVARTATAKVDGLAEAASKIGAVVRLIDEIAAQTNLLALNATIEAARAGDAGKGFAIVANEVKALAGQTAKATDEIASKVAAIQEATGEAVSSIEMIARTLENVMAHTKAIEISIERQTVATQEIAGSVYAASNGTVDLSHSVDRLKATIGDARSTSVHVVNTATVMVEEARRLDQTVRTFLTEVSA
ncbi:methyl-accepting chemotaxis protein [Chelatococcus caeni]|uniref:Methyl-accepting chemotaxis protein n=1 Tax=Chelatococcus caeni TaxID=1348468 RepID=A0A840C2I2_9HYPH|nr:methyl-accepting chemotaxis protein [Chelatococcus caeni]